MASCKDCMCYEILCQHTLQDDELKPCKSFKNKSDFVEVVRCKNCKHYDEVGECEVHPYDGRFNVNYFCADGERKDT